MSNRTKICLWFDSAGEEAALFYTSIFPNSTIGGQARYGDNAYMPKGTVMVVNFTLDGAEFMALNGGPMFTPNEAVSIMVNCENQAEVDHYWSKLSEGGKEVQCGWIKDKYGFSWQIVPNALGELMGKANEAQQQAVMNVVMNATKLNVGELQAAFDSV